MGSLNFLPIISTDTSFLSKWFVNDEDGAKRLSSYQDDQEWKRLVKANPTRHGWIVVDEEEPVGFFDLEIEGEHATFAFMVRYDKRRLGIGTRMIRQALELPEIRKLATIAGHVEPDNTASAKILARCGFAHDGMDSDGYRIFIRKLDE